MFALLPTEVMKPQEGELVSEISKAVEILFLSEDNGHLHTQLQGLVSELKVGFSSALYELSQIQHGDSDIREEVGEARRSCERKALRMETLVESLRDELGEMRCQILQLCGSNKQRSPIQQEVKVTQSALATQRDSDTGLVVNGRSHCECSASSSTSSSSNRGRVLLHCYLQGLKAGMYEGTDARHQVTMQLLHSEWEYVSTLNQLYDKYRTPPALQMDLEPYQNYLKFVEELLQRHLLFRNTLEQRLSAHDWKGLVGDIFVQLVGHNDSSFLDIYHGYTTALATFLSIEFNRIMLNGKIQSTQSYTKEREEVQLFSLLLAPVSRIHSYLTLIQSLLQWTDSDHPDCSLLQGSERVLRSILSRCHLILEDDVRWGDGGRMAGPSGSCSACPCAKSCDHRSQLCPATDTQKHRQESRDAAGKREEQQPRLSNCAAGCQSMPVARWSTGTVRKKSCYRDRTGGTFQSHLRDSGGLVYGGDISAFLHTAPPGWGQRLWTGVSEPGHGG
ncbi:rho guanine nucleotide exchange factor 33-like [Oncorhynchus masou masou]|uniref:rho guanine nucleotide exchange factor 33-like n=1 Tax=Oncorhynchus masou masou TaxID=90313 RepID=UPI0031830C81